MKPPRLTAQAPAYLALLAAVLIWGASFPAMKIAVRAWDPMFIVFVRLALASVLFLLARRSFRGIRIERAHWPIFLFMALCEPCLYFLFEAHALTLTSSSQAGMVAATMPVLTALGGHFVLKEREGRTTWVGLALAMLGVVLLSAFGQATEHAPHPVLGNALEFLAMAVSVGYVVSVRRLSPHYPPFFCTAMQTWLGSAFFFCMLFAPGTDWPRSIDWPTALSVAYLGVAVSLGAYTLYNIGISRTSASRAGAFVNLVPVVALVTGVVFLGERFTAIQYAASALVLLGVFLTTRKTKRPPQSEESHTSD